MRPKRVVDEIVNGFLFLYNFGQKGDADMYDNEWVLDDDLFWKEDDSDVA